jgi:FkbH-like protein
MTRTDRLFLNLANSTGSALEAVDSKRMANRAYNHFREKALRIATRNSHSPWLNFDAFLIEAWNPNDRSVPLIIEAHQDDLKFRTSVELARGHNLHRIPFDSMNLDLKKGDGRILAQPDNDLEVRLIFLWLDFVKFRIRPASRKKLSKPAEKIKCVVWDLDNTLWKGILAEDGAEGVSIRPESVHLLQALDERGVIQSIASKNDYALAWRVLETLGLQDYFLYPAIHWEPKSGSVRDIATELNIGVDSIAIIDDSPFERAEIQREIPSVRTYSDSEVGSLLDRPEFNLPVTEESRRRREFYLAESKRKRIAQSYSGGYEEFLRSCRLETDVVTPTEDRDIDRCLELLQRSNQLNLSTHRFERDEFLQRLADSKFMSIATRCRDCFGDYGTVGFSSIAFTEDVPLLTDFVLSCRVAKKKVENGWFNWLSHILRDGGHQTLQAWFLPTERNSVLLSVLVEVGFKAIMHQGDRKLLELDLATPPPAADIVRVNNLGVPPIRRQSKNLNVKRK